MKKLRKLFLLPLFVGLICLSSCGKKEKNISKCYLNDEGKIVILYDDNTYQELGTITDTIYKGVDKIEITEDGYYKINNFKSSIKVEFDTVKISDDGFYIIDGIKTNISATEVYTVNFITNAENVQPQKVKDGYKVVRPEMTKKGYDLEGWFYNGEEWLFNTHVVKNDMTLTANWNAKTYTVSFDDNYFSVDDMNIVYDDNFTLPVLTRDGHTFEGWFYNNKKVTNGKWNIDSNVTLTSKWTANKYEITLDPNGGTVSKTKVEVTFGEDYKLPVPTNDFGSFKGWYLDGVKLTDQNGNSLLPWTYNGSKTLTTNWIEQISTVEELKAISNAPSGYYELTNDIDLADIEWMPLCPSDVFTGVLDGKGYKIKNLTITNGATNVKGLFRTVGGNAIIKNILFDNVDISMDMGDRGCYVGTISGLTDGGALIENITINGSISVTGLSSKSIYVGSTIGCSMLSEIVFKNVVNNASVTSPNFAGGITTCGLQGILQFENCINNGNVNGRVASGISECGFCIQCKNTGQIIGTDLAAGISALLYVGDRCVNTGYIAANTSTGYAAGIGILTSNEISSSSIIQYGYIDSLDGSDNNMFIAKNCYNIGAISGYYSGGIISGDGGLMYLKAKSCYNVGEINAKSYAGGIAPITCNITDCVNFGEIKTGQIKTAICAQLTTTRRSLNCYYYGSIYNSEYCTATETTEKYASSLYSDKLGWNIYTSNNKNGIWKLQEDDYPKLAWEN